MDIGIAAENRPNERRVILRPDELKDIADRHKVFVEKGAGEIAALLDVGRVTGLAQRHAHLLGDGGEKVFVDLDADRVGS